MSELLPCPFCEQMEQGDDGPDRKALYAMPSTTHEFHLVRCGSCLAEGPLCDTPVEAIAAWNARPSPAHKATTTNPHGISGKLVEGAKVEARHWKAACKERLLGLDGSDRDTDWIERRATELAGGG